MDEIENDILIAEPEEELQESNAQSDFEESISDANDDETNMFEYKSQKDNSSSVQENKTLQKETDAFVNYNFNNLNKVYKKYDVVKTYVPKTPKQQRQNKEFETYVKQHDEYVPEQETFVVERKTEKPKYQLKPKAKAWLVSIIIIFAMLGGLSIYNAVHISNLSKQAQQTSISISTVSKKIDQAIDEIADLTDEQNVLDKADEMGLEEVPEGNKVTIELNQKNEIKEYKSQTNFFDKICNFFRRLFGGK